MESLIQKHSYARSPIRTYGGEEDVLGDEVQTTQNRGETASGYAAAGGMSTQRTMTAGRRRHV